MSNGVFEIEKLGELVIAPSQSIRKKEKNKVYNILMRTGGRRERRRGVK